MSECHVIPSLDDWAETRRQVDEMKDDVEGAGFGIEGPGYIYECGFIQGPVDGEYCLVISNQSWSSKSLERLEGILYEVWAAGEMSI